MPSEFKNLTDAREEIARLTTELAEATARGDATNSKLSAETQRAGELEAAAKMLIAERDAYQAADAEKAVKIGELEAKNAEQREKISKLEAEAATAETRAQRIVAEIGHAPIEMKKEEGDATGDDLEAQLFKLTGAERTAFFRKHRAALEKISTKQRK